MSGAGAAAAAFAGLLALGITGPTTATGSASGVSGGTVTSNTVTVAPQHPFGTYSVAWTNQTGGGIVANIPTGENTSFSKAMAADETVTDTMRCTITDSIGRTAFWEVVVTLTHSSGA